MAAETLGGKELSVEEKKKKKLVVFSFIPSVKSSRKNDLEEYSLGCVLHYLNWHF